MIKPRFVLSGIMVKMFVFLALVSFSLSCGKKGDPIPLNNEPIFSTDVEKDTSHSLINPEEDIKESTHSLINSEEDKKESLHSLINSEEDKKETPSTLLKTPKK